ncbi:MAG TPA: phage holin family protein [Methylomirabilota bacterium]|jgi:putative membrane protein|nr:phage holin family protein [Methylomirabilota bacterium]
MGFIIRIVVYTLALLLAANVVPGIRLDSLTSALVAGLLLGLINAIVRPILVVITFPITLLTLGLFLLVLNAFCLWLVSVFVSGFHVAGFWPAFWGALLVSVVSWILTALISDSGRVKIIERRRA